jgi:hypothetical protein
MASCTKSVDEIDMMEKGGAVVPELESKPELSPSSTLFPSTINSSKSRFSWRRSSGECQCLTFVCCSYHLESGGTDPTTWQCAGYTKLSTLVKRWMQSQRADKRPTIVRNCEAAIYFDILFYSAVVSSLTISKYNHVREATRASPLFSIVMKVS